LGFVKESQAGDVLIRTQDGKADSAPFVHQLRVAGFDRDGSNPISTVVLLKEHVVSTGIQWSERATRNIIPPNGQGWVQLIAHSPVRTLGPHRMLIRFPETPLQAVRIAR